MPTFHKPVYYLVVLSGIVTTLFIVQFTSILLVFCIQRKIEILYNFSCLNDFGVGVRPTVLSFH